MGSPIGLLQIFQKFKLSTATFSMIVIDDISEISRITFQLIDALPYFGYFIDPEINRSKRKGPRILTCLTKYLTGLLKAQIWRPCRYTSDIFRPSRLEDSVEVSHH